MTKVLRFLFYWLIIFPLGGLFGLFWVIPAALISYPMMWYVQDESGYEFAHDFTGFIWVIIWSARP